MSDNPDDAAWQEIVEHYGDRADLPPDESRTLRRAMPRPVDDPEPGDAGAAPTRNDEGHYVPPPPPPLPRPVGLRLVAWLGLFGAPTVMLVCLMLGVTIGSLGGFLLLVAFVGGFAYLVATMRKGRDDDGWDDGAVV